MNRYYKILKVAAEEVAVQKGNYPLTGIVPFGPPFESKNDAKSWLSENAEKGSEYYFNKFYSASIPESLVAEVKKPKDKKPKAQP